MASRIFDIKRGVISTTDAGTATFDIAVPTNSSLGFESKIVPKVASNNDGGMIVQSGSIKNDGGTVTLNGAIISIGASLATSIALVTAAFTANSTNLRLTVTGVAAIGVIDWQYEIKIIIN
jgi:hypothetical protein